ncbi:MAG: SUMF1/EgtB/PvdO family nonheme iron enzyme [Candidatus Cloacimonetes bacterium]|nr:SUMF1/EgtB/PvdO family nonheme iron enzyme [Candidatus Cloacimonadota bacterium]
MKKIVFSIVLVMVAALGFGAAPVVSDVYAEPGAGKVTITYNLVADAVCDVCMMVSDDGGLSYNIYPTALVGDIGNNVSNNPPAKTIIWNPSGDGIAEGTQYKVKVIARDNPVDNATQVQSFIKVDGGTFNNGSSDVIVPSFFMDKYEVTQAEYHAVMGNNPSNFSSVTNGPVESVSWFDAIEYCNRRSMQEGFTACYSYNDGTEYGANPANWPEGWNTNATNHSNVDCDWEANGYRLPTEAEWEFAARGGISAPNPAHDPYYSGSNNISAVAWYNDNSDSTTHTVGTKAANELGLYDMSGNVWEWVWVWDIYEDSDMRVYRGGSWSNSHTYCTVLYQGRAFVTNDTKYVGFRVCRIAP